MDMENYHGYGLQGKYTVQIHILSSPRSYIINMLQNGNKPAIFKRLNNVGVWRFCAKKKKLSFPAYHLQKSHFKIFDVSLRYSGSHFGAAAYFKMTGLKDPVFPLSPLNFPKGIPAKLTFFFLLWLLPSRGTLGSRLAELYNDLIWWPGQSSPVDLRLKCLWNYQGQSNGSQKLKRCRPYLSKFRRSAGCSWDGVFCAFNMYQPLWFPNKLDLDASIIKTYSVSDLWTN